MASAATNAGSVSEIETTIGATRLGSSSLNRIRRVGTPMTCAAWTYSAFAQRQHLAADQPREVHPAEDDQHRDEGDDLGPVQGVGLGGEPADDDRRQGQRTEQEREAQRRRR